MADDAWTVNFTVDGPQNHGTCASRKGRTVFMVPQHLRAKSSSDYDYNFKRRMLSLGLQDRTLSPEAPEMAFESIKFEIGSVLHHRLTRISSPALPPEFTSTIRCWNDFAEAVVPNIDQAKSLFERPTESPPMSDGAVRNYLALDALFLVFYFQFMNSWPDAFNIKEFRDLAKERAGALKSLDLSDFLLLENQVPMYLLKNVVRELCKIDDGLPAKADCVQKDSFERLVESVLDRVLIVAVMSLLPFSKPTVVHPIPDIVPGSQNLATACGAGGPIKRILSIRKTVASATGSEMLLKYLHFYYPAHIVHALENCKHILDCVYRVACGHVEPPYKWDTRQLENPYMDSIPSASQLQEAGIKVERSTQCTANSVELTNGWLTWVRSARLKLPKVEIMDDTGRSFRNLAVYEQLLGQAEAAQYNSDLRCYLVWMHELCRETADLRLLSRRGVIDVHVGDKVALRMWAAVLTGVHRPIPSNAWRECCERMVHHRRSWWKRWRRKHIGSFMTKPWRTLGILASVVLLALTALQTWFTVVNSRSSLARWPPRT